MKKIFKTLLPIVSIGSLAGCVLPITSCNKKDIDPADIAGIVVTSKPTKLTYAQGQYLDLTGLEVKIITKGGTKKVTTDFTSSIADKSRLKEKGEKEITIKLNGTKHTDTFKINVGEPVIEKLEITTQPTNRVYQQNKILDLDGMVVKATSSMDVVTDDFRGYTAEPQQGSVLTEWGRNTVTLTADSAKTTTDVLVTTENVKFSKASWEVISDWTYCLEAGIIKEEQFFCNHFLKEDGTQYQSLDDFIGLGKTITINGKDHTVKVIGIKHDTIDDPEYFPEGNTKATFTFQFFNKITKKNTAESLGAIYDGNNTPDYINSQVRYNLDKRGDQTKSIAWDDGSTKSLFEMLPAEFENYVWPVKKEVATKPVGESTYSVKNYTDRLFLPTLKEYAQTTCPSQFRRFIDEGEPYDYWKNHTSIGDRIISIAGGGAEERSPVSYYTATISIDEDPQKDDPLAFAIASKDGVIGSFNIGTGTNHGIAPCFCI